MNATTNYLQERIKNLEHKLRIERNKTDRAKMKECKECKNIERYEIEVVAMMTQLQMERRRREALVKYLCQPYATIEGARELL